jgi:hypothetical protein
VGARGLTAFSAALYSVVSLLPGISYYTLDTQVRKTSSGPTRFSVTKQFLSIALYLLSAAAAYVRPWLSLMLLSVVAAMWMAPPRRVEE